MAIATAEPTVLDGLKDRRAEISVEWDKLIEDRESERQEFEARLSAEKDEEKPSEEEREAYKLAEEEFRTASDGFDGNYKRVDSRIAELQGKAERRKVAETHSVEVGDHISISEPLTYRKDNAKDHSWWKDLIGTDRTLRGAVTLPNGTWTQADERLRKHGEEMEKTVMPQREARAKRESERQVELAEGEFRSSLPRSLRSGLPALDGSPFEIRHMEQEVRANPSRAPGAGGEFVPPLWLVEDDFIPYLRAGRVIAPQLRNMPVPPGTDTIKLPRVKLGTEVAPQLQDNAGVASRDIETEYVEAAIKTLAGQEDVGIQLIEQSPGQVFERVVQEDLLAAYNLVVDQNVAYGTGANYTTLNAGTIRGLFPGTSWGAEARESTSAVTPQVLLQGLGANWSALARKRYNTANVHHFVNPSFAAFLAHATETEKEKGRLLVTASDFPHFNMSGQLDAGYTPAEGEFMSTPLGPKVFHTVNIPVKANKAATALEGAAYSFGATLKTDDCWFFESDLRARVLPEVVSGTLQIRYQLYAYVGLLVRYGPSLQFCGGTPFAAEPELGGYKY